MRETTDIVISGGGVAGLTAAAAFGSAGFRVICTDPVAPITDRDTEGADLRSTAFLQPSILLLQTAGLWARLAEFASPLQVMRLVDAGGAPGVARHIHDFNASDVSDQPFGWNLPNWLLRRELVAHLATLPTVDFRPGTATVSVLTREAEALVSLGDGSRIAARLLIAADGRNSAVRAAAGIAVQTSRYGQKALAFAVTHPVPHENVSTEVHRSGGPFTLVPLQDRGGLPCSAVVWMERGPEALRLATLPVPAFEAAMAERSCHLYGPLTLASRITLWPIVSQIAERLDGQRTALIAEAAHVVPPIGAQGLNMSLADTALLLELAQSGDLGSPAMLANYNRRRWPEIRARVRGIDLLNRASMQGTPLLRDLRAAALGALHATTLVRKTVMRAGLGVRRHGLTNPERN